MIITLIITYSSVNTFAVINYSVANRMTTAVNRLQSTDIAEYRLSTGGLKSRLMTTFAFRSVRPSTRFCFFRSSVCCPEAKFRAIRILPTVHKSSDPGKLPPSSGTVVARLMLSVRSPFIIYFLRYPIHRPF